MTLCICAVLMPRPEVRLGRAAGGEAGGGAGTGGGDASAATSIQLSDCPMGSVSWKWGSTAVRNDSSAASGFETSSEEKSSSSPSDVPASLPVLREAHCGALGLDMGGRGRGDDDCRPKPSGGDWRPALLAPGLASPGDVGLCTRDPDGGSRGSAALTSSIRS